MRRWAVLLLPLVVLMSCQKAKPQPLTLRIGCLDALETLDPHRRNATGSLNVIRQMYEGLVLRDRQMNLHPGLAESWENPTDSTWRFHIRKGVRFHTGKLLDAYDVEATFRRLLEEKGLQMTTFVSHVSSVRVIDRQTIEIDTSRLALPTLSRLLFVYIVPKDYKDLEGKWDHASFGTGPYRFSSWDGTTARLERFEDYWGTHPDYQTLEFVVPPTPAQLLERLNQSELDCAKLDGLVISHTGGNYAKKSAESLYVAYLGFNLARRDMLFGDREMRSRLARSIDKYSVVRDARDGFATVTDQAVSPFVYGFNPELHPSAPEMGSASFPPHRPLVFLARQIFEETARALQSQFHRLGIQTDLTVMPDTEFFPRVRNGDFDLFVSRWSCETADASEILEACFYRRGIKEGFGNINYTGYGSEEIDRRIEESDALVDPSERLSALKSLMSHIQADCPWVPLYVNHDVYAVSNSVSWEPRMDSQIYGCEFHPLHGRRR
jgi:peptide/nickel transport system substrate-binding protein